MAFKNDVADDMAPVRHPYWPVWPFVWPPLGTLSGHVGYLVWSHWVPRLVPLGTSFGPVGHPVGQPSSRKKKNNNFIKKKISVVVADWKRGKKIFRFSVFNP
jgi:hypothetical protein